MMISGISVSTGLLLAMTCSFVIDFPPRPSSAIKSKVTSRGSVLESPWYFNVLASESNTQSPKVFVPWSKTEYVSAS